jgi:hypothetical protein
MNSENARHELATRGEREGRRSPGIWGLMALPSSSVAGAAVPAFRAASKSLLRRLDSGRGGQWRTGGATRRRDSQFLARELASGCGRHD